MITYNDIYEAARKERYTENLQSLPKDFIDSVSVYLKDKKGMASKQEEGFSDIIIKTKKQLENAITLFKELMIRRRKKILNLVLIASETGISKQDFENMISFEKDFFEELMKCAENADKKLDKILNGSDEQKKTNELVLFKEHVSEFLGFEGEKIGPFEEGQIANIPKEISKILVEDGRAEIVSE
jgi:DNA replication initiation complex subunit (GINS family)